MERSHVVPVNRRSPALTPSAGPCWWLSGECCLLLHLKCREQVAHALKLLSSVYWEAGNKGCKLVKVLHEWYKGNVGVWLETQALCPVP